MFGVVYRTGADPFRELSQGKGELEILIYFLLVISRESLMQTDTVFSLDGAEGVVVYVGLAEGRFFQGIE